MFEKQKSPAELEEAIRKKIEPEIREKVRRELEEEWERRNAESNRVEIILSNVNSKNTYRKILIEKTINEFEKSKTVKPDILKKHYLLTLEMLSDSAPEEFDYFVNTFRERVKESNHDKFDNLAFNLIDISKRASKADSGVEKFKILTEELLKKNLGMNLQRKP